MYTQRYRACLLGSLVVVHYFCDQSLRSCGSQIKWSDGTASSRVLKLLSEDPSNYKDAPTEGIRQVLEEALGRPMLREAKIDSSKIEFIRMGTTVATNALLERDGEPTALVVTAGFKDLLHIGNQSRPAIFDLRVRCPEVLYSEVVEVDESVVLVRDDLWLPPTTAGTSASVIQGTTNEKLIVERAPVPATVRSALAAVRAKGITSIAIVLKHSYMFPDHERLVANIARELGFLQVSLSSQLMPMVKMVGRGFTACADAYLTPKINTYLKVRCGTASGSSPGMRAPLIVCWHRVRSRAELLLGV